MKKFLETMGTPLGVSVGALVWMLMGLMPVHAEVSEAEAAKLGSSLTPVGAERAGNADGTIPAWEGGVAKPPAGWSPGDARVDLFADDEKLFSIDSTNVEKYASKLTPGQQALVSKYDGYRMDVYPSRRSCAYPQAVYDGTRRNATTARLDDNGDLVAGIGGFLFPMPQSGAEAVWNHKSRYEGRGYKGRVATAGVTKNGNYEMSVLERDTYSDFYDPKNNSFGDLDNIAGRWVQRVVEPVTEAGNLTLIHETVNGPRLTWIYAAGSRRIRRLPNFEYDNPVNGTEGLLTTDQANMYNGRLDRYNWELKGKRELYIPYNDAELHSPEHSYAEILTPQFPKRDLFRYELHRVWHVTATIKPQFRHVYSRREFFLDEDSWIISVADLYDSRGELWRVQEAPIGNIYELPACVTQAQFHYDLNAKQYIASQLKNQEPGYDYLAGEEGRIDESKFTPGYLQLVGRR